MHQFPPAPFPQSELGITLLHGAIFAVYLSLIIWLTRKPRKARSFDILLVTILLLIVVTLLHSPLRIALGYSTGFIPFKVLSVIVALVAVILNLNGLVTQRDKSLGFLKGLFILLQGGVFVSLLGLLILNWDAPDVRFTARRIQCLNNIRNIGVAIQNYATVHRGDIPATEAGDPPHSWRVDLLPFLEEQGLHDRYQSDQPWNDEPNREIAKTRIRVYECPSAPLAVTSEGYALTGYATITGKNAMWGKKKSLNLEAVSKGDGLSQTLLIVEACGQNIAWSEPRDVDLDSMPIGINLPGKKVGHSDGLLSGYHGGGVNVAFGDGSARFLSETIDLEVLKKLCTATGDDMLSGADY